MLDLLRAPTKEPHHEDFDIENDNKLDEFEKAQVVAKEITQDCQQTKHSSKSSDRLSSSKGSSNIQIGISAYSSSKQSYKMDSSQNS